MTTKYKEKQMIEVYKNIFVGDQNDYEFKVKQLDDWAVVHACKEPYHRQALGYTGRAANKNHPEYLFAIRGNCLILNLVDVDNPDWISPIIINKTMEFIDEAIENGKSVLIHCNQGMSRSAGIGFLYLAHIGFFSGMSFEKSEKKYIELYPPYNPARGIHEFIKINWVNYIV